ncbi:MAG: ribosomal protein S18 acetylase RimI-like enzyme [Flavobacteriaceae bacterium]
MGVCTAYKGIKNNEIRAIYILPKYQGQGIGKKLLGQSFDFLKSDKDIIVHVVTYNKNAIEFYIKNGFKKTEEDFNDKGFILKEGVVLPEITLIKNNS